MKDILKIFLVLFVLSIVKAKPVPDWEDEEEWDEAWKENVDPLDEEEDEEAWDEKEDEDGSAEDEEAWDEEAWDEEDDEKAWDEEEDEKAWDEEEDEKAWDEEEDEKAWDEEDGGEADEAWGDGDLPGGESENVEFEEGFVNLKRDLDKMAVELEDALAY